MALTEKERRATTRTLNDGLRVHGKGGRILVSTAIKTLPKNTFNKVLPIISNFTNFDEFNDPHGEHNGTDIYIDDVHISWKIHYYSDDQHHYSSPDPADPDLTTRVMTIKLFEEF